MAYPAGGAIPAATGMQVEGRGFVVRPEGSRPLLTDSLGVGAAPAPNAGTTRVDRFKRQRASSADGGGGRDSDVQNQILATQQELLQVIKDQQQALAAERTCFTTPGAILDTVEPSCKKLFIAWQKEYKDCVEKLSTASELSLKYDRLQEESKLIKTFADEAGRQWPWPKAYLQQATRINTVAGGQFSLGEDYSLAEDWKRLRRKHAEECDAFVRAHNKKVVELFDAELQPTSQTQKLRDSIISYQKKFSNLSWKLSQAQVLMQADRFAELTIRAEMPKAKGRLEKAKEEAEKRKKAVLEASSQLDKLDLRELVALAFVEGKDSHPRTSSTSTDSKTGKSKPLLVPRNSYAGQLLSHSPNLEALNLKVEGSVRRTGREKSGPSPKPRAATPKKSPTPAPSKSPGSRSRSNSVKSWKSTRSAGSQKAVSFAGKGRGKGRGKGNGKARAPSNGASKKGKGRGRGKGKGRGRASSRATSAGSSKSFRAVS